MTKYYIIGLLIILGACQSKESSQGENFVSRVDANAIVQPVDPSQLKFFENERNPLATRFELLPFGSVRPQGWILAMLEQDIRQGLTGSLDKLAPDVLSGDDLYNTTRRKSKDDIPKIKNMVLTGEPWEISIQWWNSESLGNWWDAYVRSAFLSQDKAAIQKSKKIVEYLLSTQDEDGYIGIYGEAMRYQHDDSNGELWAQTTVFRMLLGYYEITQEQKVLEAVEKAMAVTMKHYNEDAQSPFDVQRAYGGVTHGLMLTDVCETLYRITNDSKYRDYAVFLYKDFSTYPINRAFNDMRYEYLLEKDSLYESHSVHTYEHLRTLIFAYYATGYPELKRAFENAEDKLQYCILPSGGGFGDEFLVKRKADPTHTAAEFCSQFELREYYGSALQKTGKIAYADNFEKITFNTILGKRNQDGTGITYCKTDNCYALDGTSPHESKDLRFKYSPTHTDVALCCAPNYGKHLPYYTSQMWMKAADGLAAVLYGPSVLNTQLGVLEVKIEERTNYPLSDQITFLINVSEEAVFSLYFRKPNWVKSMQIESEGTEAVLEGGFYKITKPWKSGDQVKIRFEQEIQAKVLDNEEVYFQRGPIVFAYEIPHRNETYRKHKFGSFKDYFCLPTDKQFEAVALAASMKDENFGFSFKKDTQVDTKNLWANPSMYLEGEFINTENSEALPVKLIPMGNTVLRRVTIPLQKEGS